MQPNNKIEEEKFEKLAKSFYDNDQLLVPDEQSLLAEELFPDQKEKDQLLRVAKKVDLYFELKKYPVEIAWEKIQDRIHKKPESKIAPFRRLILNPVMRIAAAVLVTAILTIAGYEIYVNKKTSGQLLEISANHLAVSTFNLPDGTLVSLNSNTHLKYPKKFEGNTREVIIEGEAFFEVKPDKKKPFIIHAGKAQIKVLGTSFNVNAYPSASLLEVIVKTGKVQVLNNPAEPKQNNELILAPGDKGTLVYSSNQLVKTTNLNPNFIAWKTHDLIFKATSLGEVIGTLEKVYKVNIRLADPKLSGLLLTAHFNDYSLDFILKVIESTFQMETQKTDGQYILKAKS